MEKYSKTSFKPTCSYKTNPQIVSNVNPLQSKPKPVAKRDSLDEFKYKLAGIKLKKIQIDHKCYKKFSEIQNDYGQSTII